MEGGVAGSCKNCSLRKDCGRALPYISHQFISPHTGEIDKRAFGPKKKLLAPGRGLVGGWVSSWKGRLCVGGDMWVGGTPWPGGILGGEPDAPYAYSGAHLRVGANRRVGTQPQW